MPTADPFRAVQDLGLVQRQAGVDPETAELVVAWSRLILDSGQAPQFAPDGSRRGAVHASELRRLTAKNPDVHPDFLEFLARYAEVMASHGRVAIYSTRHLAELVDVDLARLQWICRRQQRFYRERAIPKKDGSERVLHSPRQPVRRLQRWIHENILGTAPVHEAAHGFHRGRSIVSNARVHVGKSVVVRLDIADFFPSITFQQVRKTFQRLGYPYRVAVMLANLCTRRGRLPQGGITSPALSNLACRRLDRRLSGLARQSCFEYTRYADDLVVSSDNPDLPNLIPFLKDIVAEEGFRIRDDKTRIMRRGARQCVTGVVTNQKPNLGREHVRRLRAAIHRLGSTGGAASVPSDERHPIACDRSVLAGHLGLLAMVNPEAAKRLRERYRRAIGSPG